MVLNSIQYRPVEVLPVSCTVDLVVAADRSTAVSFNVSVRDSKILTVQAFLFSWTTWVEGL